MWIFVRLFGNHEGLLNPFEHVFVQARLTALVARRDRYLTPLPRSELIYRIHPHGAGSE
jgi:hypothetical protein